MAPASFKLLVFPSFSDVNGGKKKEVGACQRKHCEPYHFMSLPNPRPPMPDSEPDISSDIADTFDREYRRLRMIAVALALTVLAIGLLVNAIGEADRQAIAGVAESFGGLCLAAGLIAAYARRLTPLLWGLCFLAGGVALLALADSLPGLIVSVVALISLWAIITTATAFYVRWERQHPSRASTRRMEKAQEFPLLTALGLVLMLFALALKLIDA